MRNKYRAEKELHKRGLKTVDSFLTDLSNYLESRIVRVGNVKGLEDLSREIEDHLRFLNPTNENVRRYFLSKKASYTRLHSLLVALRNEIAQVAAIFLLENSIDFNNPRQVTNADFIKETEPILLKLNGYNASGKRQPGLIKKFEDLFIAMEDVPEL